MFKAIAESRQIGYGAEQIIAIDEILFSSWIEPKGTSLGKGSLSSSAFQESLRKMYS